MLTPSLMVRGWLGVWKLDESRFNEVNHSATWMWFAEVVFLHGRSVASSVSEVT